LAACFAAAASALRALPAAFLVFSPPPFFPGMVDADNRGMAWFGLSSVQWEYKNSCCTAKIKWNRMCE
jgi:hypothetical protein